MITAEDMARFSIEAPRYTSYPTAAEFVSEIGAPDLRDGLAELPPGSPGAPLPVGLYVHLPFCREICHFCGCHALVARTPERIARYLDCLTAEAAAVGDVLGRGRAVAELHFGGGSPSFLEADDFERVVSALRSAFAFAAPASVSLEADPRTTDLTKLRRYRALGVGRISFGVQDLDEEVQRAIGRNQARDVSLRAYRLAREVGFDGINLDLCYGLPGQTEATMAATVSEVIALRPDRVALFGYAHVPWMKPMQRLIPAASLPRADLRIRLVASARAAFIDAGYQAIGLDHFALPSDELARAALGGTLHRNFQGYTATGTDALIGLGTSAISDLPRGYFQNQRKLGDYQRAVDGDGLATERGVLRTADDRVRGEIIGALMCRGHLDLAAIEERYDLAFATAFAAEIAGLRELEAEGLVRLDLEGRSLDLTPLGTVFVRNVARVFDAHRRAGGAARGSVGARFSATV
jgi:oxygen-independent coproporphyrinogen III oxidase